MYFFRLEFLGEVLMNHLYLFKIKKKIQHSDIDTVL